MTDTHTCPPGHLYVCPTAREVESSCHGGFTTCCDRPDLHVPIPDGPGAEALSVALSEAAKREHAVTSTRFFWSSSWDSPWWRPLILIGVRGGDENCNRTIGLRLPGGALFLCLNVPLRQELCGECREWLTS